MKFVFECVESGVRMMTIKNEGDKLMYYANFGIARDKASKQNHYGELKLESIEPLHYKPGKKYDVVPTEHSGITVVGSIPPTPIARGKN